MLKVLTKICEFKILVAIIQATVLFFILLKLYLLKQCYLKMVVKLKSLSSAIQQNHDSTKFMV